ncbi:molybdopterin molybdenumtransferase MoeA [Aureimonas sp. SA4125]|uniref:molybdopterin molybdotransferase MoeA n=1 Tax=Aureimonas sp. SA4125 TaxID=2826993 RepID=UPI001CC6125E|nr:gephyrin-like molybdotransferase Glp [Aureimonas sp. SA4125]BDA84147.1 molybdopterin molybdenumtransferase MoeA [Aureimonas sp. SA4125]
MAQLSDDCFAFGGPMRTVAETVALIRTRLLPVTETERVGLALADGRVTSEVVMAGLPLPAFTNSAVDGYAVRGTDLPTDAPQAFALADRIQAGMAPSRPLAPGETVRIFTGAPMPAGADTVFMQEDTVVDPSGRILLPPGLSPGANVRPAGEDVAPGRIVIASGHRLRPQDVALLAALGQTEVAVLRRVRVAVFSTGNEIVAPGDPLGPAQVYDSNRFMLMAMLARLGCTVTDLGILADAAGPIADALAEAAANHDLILASGGVSTGEADHVKSAVEAVGSLTFWRVAIKPGRPVAMGVVKGAAFIGLPGNPVASFVTFARIARPAILALAGTQETALPATPLRAAFAYAKKRGRREYVRVTLLEGADGVLEAHKFPREGAGLLSSLVDTDGLVELDEESAGTEVGATVAFIPYAALI